MLARLAAGPASKGGAQPAAPDPKLVEAVVGLAQATYQARAQGRPPEPDLAEALAQVAQAPGALGISGRFCRR